MVSRVGRYGYGVSCGWAIRPAPGHSVMVWGVLAMRRFGVGRQRWGSALAVLMLMLALAAADHADLLRLEEAAKPIIGSVRLPLGAVRG